MFTCTWCLVKIKDLQYITIQYYLSVVATIEIASIAIESKIFNPKMSIELKCVQHLPDFCISTTCKVFINLLMGSLHDGHKLLKS